MKQLLKRIIVLPLFAAITLTRVLYTWIRSNINFLRNGGVTIICKNKISDHE